MKITFSAFDYLARPSRLKSYAIDSSQIDYLTIFNIPSPVMRARLSVYPPAIGRADEMLLKLPEREEAFVLAQMKAANLNLATFPAEIFVKAEPRKAPEFASTTVTINADNVGAIRNLHTYNLSILVEIYLECGGRTSKDDFMEIRRSAERTRPLTSVQFYDVKAPCSISERTVTVKGKPEEVGKRLSAARSPFNPRKIVFDIRYG